MEANRCEHANRALQQDLEQLKVQLEQQRNHKMEQERKVSRRVDGYKRVKRSGSVFVDRCICSCVQIAVLEESMKSCEEETKDLQSQDEQVKTAPPAVPLTASSLSFL